jgi:hypothetical protein
MEDHPMAASRRDFLRSATAVAALPASWHAFRSKVLAAPHPGDDAFWKLVKS